MPGSLICVCDLTAMPSAASVGDGGNERDWGFYHGEVSWQVTILKARWAYDDADAIDVTMTGGQSLMLTYTVPC